MNGVLAILLLAQLNAYWPAKEGSWIRYVAFRVLTYWDSGSRQLSVLQRYPHSDNHFVQIRWVDSPSLARSFNEKFVNKTAAGDVSELGEMQFEVNGLGQSLLGEVGRADAKFLVIPPEPKLPVDAAVWHRLQQWVMTTYHQVVDSRSGTATTWPMLTKFATVGHYDRWGVFPDVWCTSLEELTVDGRSLAVYNYAFERGVGLVNFWYVNEWPFDANHMAWGWEYYAIAWSQ